MAAPDSSLFRREALERISSPERLDHLLRITAPREWLALAALAGLIVAAGAWSVWGRLPVTVTGRAVLTYPRTIQSLDAPGDGRVRALQIRPGDVVRRGDVIARIERPDLDRELTETRNRLAELTRQDQQHQTLDRDLSAIEIQEMEVSRSKLDLQRQAVTRAITDAETMAPSLQRRLDSQRALQKAGLIPAVSETLLQAEQAVRQNQTRLRELRAELRQLDLERAQLDTRRRRMGQSELERSTARQNAIEALQAEVAVLEARADATGTVRSEQEGRVVELLVSEGQLVGVGTRLASLETDRRTTDLACLLYLPVRDGKRVQSGAVAQVTPDVVSRERFGGIHGRVTAVSLFPVTREAVVATVGSREVAEHLTTAEPHVEALVALEADPSTPSGYRWSSSSGPPLALSAGTTAMVRVVVEERAPITYVLPFLRSLTGVY
jgi:HlyD family secretion protein